jgi:hypothetical protein
MGTDIPLIVGMTVAAGLDGTSVLVMFGAMQILTGLAYRVPMPVQPLKAMAAIVIAQQLPAGVLYGAGLAVGVIMLFLSASGLLEWLARTVPKSVIRGIQLGLALQLASVALGKYVQSAGAHGYLLALAAFVLTVLLLGNRRLPAALPVVLLGLLYALVFQLDGSTVKNSFGFGLPQLRIPGVYDVASGLVLLALPQIPLSLGNSLLATWQLTRDLFPERPLSIRKLGLTYALMNLVNPWLGGIPTCHGSGGLMGHYAFGGRTGGSVVIYGLLFLTAGLFLGSGFGEVARAFPLPVLGVLLLFESLGLIWMIRDVARSPTELPVAALVGLLAAGLPYGYLIGMVTGTLLVRLGARTRLVDPETAGES